MGAALHRALVEGAGAEEDGSIVPRMAGTPQGGVISPLLANLFLHYTFDMWMARTHPHIPFERYADDIICHCKSADEARALWSALADRLTACKLTLHPEKTKIVYCKDANRRGDFPNKSFDFLGFTFRARKTIWQGHIPAHGFMPAASPAALKAMSRTIRRWALHHRSDKSLQDLAAMYNRCIGGWINYYGHFYHTQLRPTLTRIDAFLVRWARRKSKRFRHRTGRERLACPASPYEPNALRSLAALLWQRPNIGSRVNQEVHARFWERAEVKFLRATRHVWTVPAVQEESDYQRSVRVRSCIRPRMMVSPSSADLGRPRSKAGLSSLQAFPAKPHIRRELIPTTVPHPGRESSKRTAPLCVNGAVAPCRTTATFPWIGGLLRVRSADRTAGPIRQQALVAPSGTTPSMTNRHSAISSFRARATTIIFRARRPVDPTRSRNQRT